jgi:alkylation response protein AidB-like acyl-CoA dehydrogenase
VPTVDELRSDADAWLDANASTAPRDYGAIVPVELAGEARAWQRRLADAGFAGIHWPEASGGRGLTPAHTAAWIAACSDHGVPAFLNMVGHVLAANALIVHGTEAQQARWLPPTITGDAVWCQLFSEPGAGSDLASLSMKAEPDGATGGWRLTGQKVWCSNGRVADLGICLARTDPDAPRHAGISYFVVDMHAPGVETRPLRQMTGEAEFDEVFLTDVLLGPDALVGPVNAGWTVAMATLTNERGHIGSAARSLQRRLDSLLADAKGLDAVTRDRLVALWCRGAALLSLARRQGPVATVSASLLKLGVTELLFEVAELRSSLAGPDAMLASTPAAMELLGAPGGRIAGGTTQVQRTIIGERILGLPK